MTFKNYPELVDKYYGMDPETEVLLFDGTKLEEGMVVLVESYLNRQSLNQVLTSAEAREFALIRNRWCMVSNILIDDNGQEMYFIATYQDGEQRKMSVPVKWAWLAKKDNLDESDVMDITASTFNPRIV